MSRNPLSDLKSQLTINQQVLNTIASTLDANLGPNILGPITSSLCDVDYEINKKINLKTFDLLEGKGPTAIIADNLDLKIESPNLVKGIPKPYGSEEHSFNHLNSKAVNKIDGIIKEIIDVKYTDEHWDLNVVSDSDGYFKGYFTPADTEVKPLEPNLSPLDFTFDFLPEIIGNTPDGVYSNNNVIPPTSKRMVEHVIVSSVKTMSSDLAETTTKLVVYLSNNRDYFNSRAHYSFELYTYIKSEKVWIDHKVFCIFRDDKDFSLVKRALTNATGVDNLETSKRISHDEMESLVRKYCSLFEILPPAEILIPNWYKLYFVLTDKGEWTFKIKKITKSLEGRSTKEVDVLWGSLPSVGQHRIKETLDRVLKNKKKANLQAKTLSELHDSK
ncbi:MAG: hypothetical protein IBX57_00920 [Gammaproteobacteria bacterium]|nr:hypothetical protein [Gammaproteobacteria bacterium]